MKILKWIGKILLVLFALVCSFALVFLIWMKTHSVDEPLQDDSDLIPVITKVPDDQNGYFALKKAVEKMYWPEGKKDEIEKILTDGKVVDQKFVQELLDRNMESLKEYDSFLAAEKFQFPQLINIDNLTNYEFSLQNPSLGEITKINKIAIISVLQKNMQFSDSGAVENLLQIMKGANLIETSSYSAINYLIGLSLKTLIVQQLKLIVENDYKADFSKYVSRLDSYRENKETLKQIFQGEYLITTKALADISGDSAISGPSSVVENKEISSRMIRNNYYFKPNATRNLFAQQVRAFIADSEVICKERQKPKSFLDTKSGRIKIYLKENAAGIILRDVFAKSMSGIYQKPCTFNNRLEEVRSKFIKN